MPPLLLDADSTPQDLARPCVPAQARHVRLLTSLAQHQRKTFPFTPFALTFALLACASLAHAGLLATGSPGGMGNGPGAPSTVPREPLPPRAAPDGSIVRTPVVEVGGYAQIEFNRLGGYVFHPPDYDPVATPQKPPPSVDGLIPPEIRALHDRPVRITGYMLPLKMKGALVTDFMLLSSPNACCYGVMPNLNEWVQVKVTDPAGVPVHMDTPLAVYGRLHVGGVFEQGYLTSLYQLAAERVEAATTD